MIKNKEPYVWGWFFSSLLFLAIVTKARLNRILFWIYPLLCIVSYITFCFFIVIVGEWCIGVDDVNVLETIARRTTLTMFIGGFGAFMFIVIGILLSGSDSRYEY